MPLIWPIKWIFLPGRYYVVVYFLTLISASDHLISRKISRGNLSFYQPNPDTKLPTCVSPWPTAPLYQVATWAVMACTRLQQAGPSAHSALVVVEHERRLHVVSKRAHLLVSPLHAPMHGEPALSRRSLRCGARDLCVSGVRRLFPCQQSMLSV